MLDELIEENSENNILYELLIHSEWPQEPEIQGKGSSESPEYRYAISTLNKWLGPFGPPVCPSILVQQLRNTQLPWQFAIEGEGRVVAILQQQSLEIRSSRDDYGSVFGRVSVDNDPYPHWRKIVWSPDCTMLALAYSNGKIDVYDLIGAHLFTIPSPSGSSQARNSNQNFSDAVCEIIFCDLRVKNIHWSYELLTIDYKGTICSYFVSPSDGFENSHKFSVSSYYSNGINALCYHRPSHLLIVSGKLNRNLNAGGINSNNSAFQLGITSWRMLVGQPYYKLSLSLEDEMIIQQATWFQVLSNYWKSSAVPEDLVYKMSISPNEKILATIHTSGSLMLWDLPSMHLRKSWELSLQPNYSENNPQFCEPSMKRQFSAVMANIFKYHLVDISWWNDDALILARSCGALSVSSIYSLKNLLGISPEWFEPSVQISPSSDRGFLAMECETFITSKKRSADITDNVDQESTDEDELSFFTKSANITKQVVYYVTDNDRFRPPRKKLKFLNKTYRLLCLKSTTPEELFSRKINNEEYGEALVLAKTYGLDSDLVYQRQWRSTPATVSTIQDYLSKITKRAWVLHECMERVPETIEAAKELLMYGLCGTDLQAVIAVGKNEDHGRFLIIQPTDDDDEDDESYDEFSFEQAEKRKLKIQQKQAELLKQIDFSKLTLEQKQLCECRLKLLLYLDKLSTYEAILGGPGIADEFYDHNFFKKFRTQSGFEACINFAHDSNWQAIAAMFTYHGKEALSHWLTILQNFPETTSPNAYQVLFPKLSYCNGKFESNPWNEDNWRVADWCEAKYETSIPSIDDFAVDYYEEHQELLKYSNLTSELLTEWFSVRAHQIENKCCLVDNALDLIKLGMERNVQGLEKLLDYLLTLDVLVYECNLDKEISLKELEQMNNFEIVLLLMSKSNDGSFVKQVKQWLLPFLDRVHKHEAGNRIALFKRYLVNVSKDNLTYCRKIVESSKRDLPDPVIPSVEDQISTAINCAYACERSDCLKDVCIILEHLPNGTNRHFLNSDKQRKEILDLAKHVRVTELFEKNGTSATLGFVKTCSQNNEEMKKLLTKLTRSAGRRHPILDDSEWKSLFLDILEVQALLHHCISALECLEIYLQSLLCTGRTERITIAGKMMECREQPKEVGVTATEFSSQYRLPYKNSVSLVLKASQEYFNSAANPDDPCMDLAWSCLKLIEDSEPSVEEERDLISALYMLLEFNIHILPLQVRLCNNRLKFIDQALCLKNKAYKSSQKLMKLAFLLRVCGDNKRERDGKVLSLVAEAAFLNNDYEPCLNSCIQLMNGKYEEGWEVCYDLGKCIKFSNITARYELMSFALVHCSIDLIEEVLKAKHELKLEMLSDRVNFLVGDKNHVTKETESNRQTQSEQNSVSNPLWQTGEKTLQVLQNTTKTTKAVFSTVSSTHFWKDAVSWMKPRNLGDNSQEGTNENKFLNMEASCAFYSGLLENAHISQIEANYERYARPDLDEPTEIAFKIYRASLIHETLKNNLSSDADPSVIIDLVKAYLPEDTALGFFSLLTLEKIEYIEKIFDDLPKTLIVLELAKLCCALKISGLMNFDYHDDEKFIDPVFFIKLVMEEVSSRGESSANFNLERVLTLFKKYEKMSRDFIQAEILHSIGGGVDAARFTADDVYKKETILGIAMTSDENVFNTAVDLANSYNLPLWDVYMAQLEYLFTDSRTNSVAIEEKMKRLKLLNVLLKDPTSLKEKLEQCIYPSIDGKDHAMLLSFFQMLELCGDELDSMGTKHASHKKLLTKFKASAKGLDYKLLVEGGSSALPHLSSLLNESNVHVFAKNASKIPNHKQLYQPSIIYCLWLKKYFFEGTGSTKLPKSNSEWLHHFESCSNILKKLNPKDVLNFVDHIVFSELALEKLTVTSRAEIIKRALTFCKKNKSDSAEHKEHELSWQSIISSLQKYSQHLQRLQDPMFEELRDNDNTKITSYLKDFDLSRSDLDKLRSLIARVVLEGPDLALLKTLLACCPAEVDWQPSDAYVQSIRLVIDDIRNSAENPSTNSSSYVEILEKILQDISINNDELMIDDMAVDILYSFCQDPTVPVVTRLQVLQVLKRTSYFSEEYSDMLLLYQTQAVVSSISPNLKVSEDDVSDESNRLSLFNKLITFCCTVEQLSSLCELLCHWPQFKNGNNDVWATVLCKLAAVPEKKGLDKTVSMLERASSFTFLEEGFCRKIYEEVSKHQSLPHMLKFAFKTKHSDLHVEAISILKQCTEASEQNYDEELLRLVLEQHLTVQIVNTTLYQPVIRMLLECQSKDSISVNTVVKELLEAGHKAEAGSLMLMNNRTHPALSTFTSAFKVLNNWISK